MTTEEKLTLARHEVDVWLAALHEAHTTILERVAAPVDHEALFWTIVSLVDHIYSHHRVLPQASSEHIVAAWLSSLPDTEDGYDDGYRLARVAGQVYTLRIGDRDLLRRLFIAIADRALTIVPRVFYVLCTCPLRDRQCQTCRRCWVYLNGVTYEVYDPHVKAHGPLGAPPF